MKRKHLLNHNKVGIDYIFGDLKGRIKIYAPNFIVYSVILMNVDYGKKSFIFWANNGKYGIIARFISRRHLAFNIYSQEDSAYASVTTVYHDK